MSASQYVAFLRAVNVGGRIVKMTELKKIFEAAKLDEVSTFIASGNVLFRSAKAAAALEPQIEAALQKALGYTVATMLRTAGELRAVAEHEAFPPATMGGATLYVGFMQAKPTAAAVKRVLALGNEVDELRVNGREIYWLAHKSIADSTISMAKLEKATGTTATFRNINTVRRLTEKFPGS